MSAFFRVIRMKENFVINKRLLCAAQFVRRGARVCDVGTDHAYLPIFLCKAGIAERALASDINEGPCRRAEENVRLHGCGDKIEVVCADGLSAAQEFSPTDIVICGMGGELIRDIVFASDIARDPNVRLIMQPMTKAPALRDALVSRGFSIVGEAVVRDDKLYQIIVAEYTGKRRSLTETELLLGPVNIEKRGEYFDEFVEDHIAKQKKILLNKKLHGIPCAAEEKLIAALEEILNRHQ